MRCPYSVDQLSEENTDNFSVKIPKNGQGKIQIIYLNDIWHMRDICFLFDLSWTLG